MVKKPRGGPYEIGYKKPPKATQFQPGQSGNRRGRPKGTKNFSTLLDQELNRPIQVTEGGVTKKISKRAAIAKQMVNKAMTGDPKALTPLLTVSRQLEREAPPTAPPTWCADAADQAVLDNFRNRMRAAVQAELQASAEPPTPSTDPEET